jgi:osmotically-inducible protein OsmY
MINSTPISEMLKFRLGTKIICSDGEEGSLSSIGFDAARQSLFALAIRVGRFFGKTVYVPFAHVVDATSSAITLDITCEELLSASNTVPVGVWLDSRCVVVNTATSARGTLILIAIHPSREELSYIVARHLRPGQDTLLSADVVTKIDANQITVSLPEATLQTLPPYRTDEELQKDVERVIFELTPLHVDLHAITMRVVDGVLYLDGNISSSLRAEIVADQAVGIQGLLEVQNRLIGDDALASNVALALGRDPHTRDLPIGVYPCLGIVRLSGAVHNDRQKDIAAEITKGIPDVCAVENDLVVRPDSELLSVLAPTANAEAQDLVPGKYIRHTK